MPGRVGRFLERVKERSLLFDGAAGATMLRSDAYWFTRLGTFVERADNTARILDVKYCVLLPKAEPVGGSVDYYQWATILRSVSALRSYHWVYRDRIKPWLVAELLILRPEMPRSLMSRLGEIARQHRHHRLAECLVVDVAVVRAVERDRAAVWVARLDHQLLGAVRIEEMALVELGIEAFDAEPDRKAERGRGPKQDDARDRVHVDRLVHRLADALVRDLAGQDAHARRRRDTLHVLRRHREHHVVLVRDDCRQARGVGLDRPVRDLGQVMRGLAPEKRRGPTAMPSGLLSGGAKRDRTADLYNAIVALSQLSYGPETLGRLGAAPVIR